MAAERETVAPHAVEELEWADFDEFGVSLEFTL